ncbi:MULTISPECIES: hypothetical protein [Bacillus]|nr:MULTISPECIES: hypothetical protein [Bacillus]MCX2824531.1 hypothetical protein [Bacillus sp. DHT2]MDR4915734.1 hypothetical protein [Bacillus pseudomycoides]MED4651269.1 hypothetical protein [Bacillus pseudomycoides]
MDCKPCENNNEIKNDSSNYTKFISAAVPDHIIFKEVDTNLSQEEND